MANRVKDMNLAEIISGNVQRICKEHDLSSNDLATRAGMPQKTVWSIMSGNHSCRIDNLEKLSRTLLVSNTAIVTPHLPTNILMSRRVPRLIEKYAKLSMEDRDRLESFMDTLGAPAVTE